MEMELRTAFDHLHWRLLGCPERARQPNIRKNTDWLNAYDFRLNDVFTSLFPHWVSLEEVVLQVEICFHRTAYSFDCQIIQIPTGVA